VSQTPGENTRDILALRQAHPAEKNLQPGEREDDIRRVGRRDYILGTAVFLGTFVLALVIALISEQRVFETRPGQLFAVMALMALMALGGSLVINGRTERRERNQRASVRVALKEIAEMREQLHLAIGLVAPLPGRLDQTSERLDRIGDAMTHLAASLPDELLSQHWKGFSDAVREGFGERTGTEGSKRRPSRHLGIAHPDPPSS